MKLNIKIIIIIAFFTNLSCNDLDFEYPYNILLIKRLIREIPKSYIEKAINLFKEKNGKIIVELGTMRYPFQHDLDTETCLYCMDGHSTLLWARANAEIYSVDIDPKAIELTKEVCKNFKNVNVILQDGIEFLKNFNKPIDLLYLDAWDANVPNSGYAEKHLEAYEAAKKNLHNNSIILIDDTDIYEGGKGKLVIPKAISDGYRIIFVGRQTLLTK